MKISREKTIKFAKYEFELRNSEWDDNGDPTWTLEDEILQDESHKLYCTVDDAAIQVATMMFDGIFRDCDLKDLRKHENFYGKKIWELAKNYYVIGNHDT